MASATGALPREMAAGKGRLEGQGLGEWLLPSFSDCLFLAVLVWLYSAGSGGWIALLADGDSGWHIRTGEYILSTGGVPHQDLFSFSKAGAPWFAWEWLTDVCYALLHQWAGLKGLVVVSAVGIGLFAWLQFRQMAWRGSNTFILLGVTLLSVGCSSIHFLARPHLVTLVGVAAGTWLIEADRRRASKRIWLLVPVTVVWVNMHGGFLALLALLGLLTVGTAVENIGLGNFRPALRYAGLTAACGAASLVNPYGWHLHAHIVAYLRNDWIKDAIQEFQSPVFRGESMMQFEILLFLGLAAVVGLLRRRQVTPALWVLFWAHSALTSARHIPVYAAVAAPVVAGELSRLWGAWTKEAGKGTILRILSELSEDCMPGMRRSSLWIFAAVVGMVVIGEPLHWPKDFPEVKFPTGMVAKYGERIAGARVLTSDQWADYLIYRNYPRQRVFCDGRSDFFGKEIGQEYTRMVNGQWQWEELLERYRFDLVLAQTDWPLASLLKKDARWRVVEDDGKAVLFERRGRGQGEMDGSKGPVPSYQKTGRPEKNGHAYLMKAPDSAEGITGDQQS